MYAPDVVLDELPNGYVLLVGSGDREKPLHKDLVKEDGDNLGYPFDIRHTDNYFFMLRDFPDRVRRGWGTRRRKTASVAVRRALHEPRCSRSRVTITPSDADLAGKKGWYLALSEGEQVVTSAITVFGGTTFSTHEPTDPADKEACTSDLGTARVYNVRYASAAPASRARRTDSRRSSRRRLAAVARWPGLVKLDDGTIVPFIIGGNGASPLEGGEPTRPALTTLPKSITYWYIEK
jgi:type IV pilus assembly protein PilY1